MISFTIWITNLCNMRCTYCYENGKIKRNYSASIEDIDRIIEFIVHRASEEKKDKALVINIHGGEPLLVFDKIVYFFNESRNKLKGYNLSYNIVTNGTLLNREKVFWLNQNMNTISLSLDGYEEIHDRNRKYVDGRGTFQDIMSRLNHCDLDKRKVRIRMTVKSNTVHALADSISYFCELGFLTIIPSLDYEDQGWNSEKLVCLESQLKKVKLQYRNNQSVMIGMIDRKELKRKTFCGGGINKFDILPNGDIYPCTIVAGLEEYKIGDIFNGIDKKKSELCDIYSTPNEQCSGCTYIQYCLGTRCKYLNKMSTGDYHMTSNLICKVENIKYRMYKM